MTCKEKLRQDHPEMSEFEFGLTIGSKCPGDFGYPEDPARYCRFDTESCTECWDQEIPETEIKKENDIMPVNAVNPDTRKMTKKDLLEEIEFAHNHIRELKDKLNNLEKYKQYEDMANEMKAMHTAFVNSGFSDEQAFDMLKTLVGPAVHTALRGMRL